MRRTFYILGALAIVAAVTIPIYADNSDGNVTVGSWDDGWATLSSYTWTGTRYGEQRTGTAVAIYVAEPFSESQRVKVDDPAENPGDTFPAYKLNLVRDFQTGIYDYNTMTSTFSRVSDLSPVKVTFTAAEWCGHVYEELNVHEGRVEGPFYSYFEGESGTRSMPVDEDAVLEDNLLIALRGLTGAYLEPGESRQVELLPSAFQRRLRHVDGLETVSATVERSGEPETVRVPAGRIACDVYTVAAGDRTGTFHVELAYPHRVVQWEWTGGGISERAELTGSARLEYWKLHREGDERYLELLGLR